LRQTRNSTVFAIEGKVKAGRKAAFDVVVLNKSFLWVRGSAEDLEKDGVMIPRDQIAASVLDDDPAVVVRAPDFELARALMARRSAAQLRSWTVTGDVEPYLAAFATLGTLPSRDLAE